MYYSESQINDYITDYLQTNTELIKSRLRFLLDNSNPDNPDNFFPPAVNYCFEEARHTFMMGDFVACIIMCAVTIERQLSNLLSLPYYDPVDEKLSLEGVGEKIIKSARNKGIINEDLEKKILELNSMRNDFVHGIDSSKHKRPQKQDSIENALMWVDSSFSEEIENYAKTAIKIMFEVLNKLHYSKLNYF